jgi:hypothetical protein
MATQDNTQQPHACAKWGRYKASLANNGSSGEMKLVAAGESIFHKFIILQAFPEMDRGKVMARLSAPVPRTPACDTLYPL